MSVSPECRIDAITRLALPEPVHQFLLSLDAPGAMKRLFNEPYYFYTQGPPEQPGEWTALSSRNLLPLWEHGELVFAVDIAQNSPEYISFYLECPTEYSSYGKSIYRALLHMIELHVWEYGGEEEEVKEAQEFATSLEFPEVVRLHALIASIEASQEQVDAYVHNI